MQGAKHGIWNTCHLLNNYIINPQMKKESSKALKEATTFRFGDADK